MTTHRTKVMLLDRGSETLLGLTFRLHLSGFAADIFQSVDDALNWARNCPADNYLCLIVNAADGRLTADTLFNKLARQAFDLPVLFTVNDDGAYPPEPVEGHSNRFTRCEPESLVHHLHALQRESAMATPELSQKEYPDA